MTRDCDIDNAAVEALEEYGIKVQDSDGNFRFLSDILDEVSKVCWERALLLSLARCHFTISPSASNKLSEAAQCLISSFKNASIPEQDDTALDDFLKQFERSDENADETQRCVGCAP